MLRTQEQVTMCPSSCRANMRYLQRLMEGLGAGVSALEDGGPLARQGLVQGPCNYEICSRRWMGTAKSSSYTNLFFLMIERWPPHCSPLHVLRPENPLLCNAY